MTPNPSLTLEDFQRRLGTEGPDSLLNYYLLEGIPHIFQGNPASYFEFKAQFATGLGVHTKSIVVVGSARLGFSISPDSLWRAFDEGKDSDIDVVVVDPSLFDFVWHELCVTEMTGAPDREEIGGLSRRRNLLYRGTIDPKLLPHKSDFTSRWSELLARLSGTVWDKQKKREVNAWIYRDWWFVQKYYADSMMNALNALRKRNCATIGGLVGAELDRAGMQLGTNT